MDFHNRVSVDISNAIATVSLNRPEKHNGLDEAMILGLIAAAKAIRKNRSIRCVILTGSGASFCAGLDFGHVAKNPSMIPRLFAKLPWTKDNRFQRVAHIWRDLPIPVIAAIHGNCFGGGIQIALACDYRIATPDAHLSIMEMKWGLIPDMSGMVTLSRLTTVDRAMELIMTGRIFTGEQAREYGLVSELNQSPLEAANGMATTIASKSPDAIAAAKYLLKKTWKKETRSTLLWERLVQLRLLGRKNQKIAMHNGMAKDEPAKQFLDRTQFR